MTNDQTIEQIQTYIDELKSMINDPDVKANDKQHLRRALDAYDSLYSDALSGKVDPDIVFENITSFMYMLQ